jgi:hypothetical protein
MPHHQKHKEQHDGIRTICATHNYTPDDITSHHTPSTFLTKSHNTTPSTTIYFAYQYRDTLGASLS